MIERRAAFLVEYQDAAYANRYRSWSSACAPPKPTASAVPLR
jgi:hypothetical protein